jgi:fumarate hydratase class II
VSEFRIEHDTMGEVRVPADALYGAQTQRAVENFPISGSGLEPAQIVALAQIKRAAAIVNEKLGIIPADIRDAIVASADDIIAGKHHDHFPVDTYQTGSGTSSNMNINEVLGNLATAKRGDTVHPNDHVNASQSSNDVFPTSVHLAVTAALLGDAIPALDHLAASLEKKAKAWATMVKPGRTHLMDATPVTLGQEFGGYARQIRLGIERIQSTIVRVAEVPLGGTAVGTGINTPAGFSAAVIAELASSTKLPVTEANDHFEAQGARDGLVEASGALRVIAVSLTKICNDIPVMGTSLLESIRLLANSSRVLADKTVDGLEANVERAAALAGMSPSIVTPLNRIIGYEAAAKIAKHSVKAGLTVRDAVIDLGYVERGEITLEQLDAALDLLSMTRPGVAK